MRQAAENHRAEIISLEPVFKHTIWGGANLREKYGYSVLGDDVGECWGIAAHENGDCTVKSGSLAGKKLSWLWKNRPELFGGLKGERFPLLVKIIDARSDLSIQVHPNDEYAMEHENGSYGKTECWYVLDCPDQASLVIGHNAGTREELREMIREKRWPELIREVPVKKGDFLQIEPGTVHAIKGGMTLLEIQQNSDITYRVYDYERLSGGQPRPLHIRESLEVITVPAPDARQIIQHTDGMEQNRSSLLISCPFYQIYKIVVNGTMQFHQDLPFLCLSVAEGTGKLNGSFVKKGDHMLLPHQFGEVRLQGDMLLIAAACGTGEKGTGIIV